MDEVPGKVALRSPVGAKRTAGRRRGWAIGGAAAALLAGLIAVHAWRDTLADPQVRQTTLPLRGLAPATGPLRVLLMSDLHVAAPDMPPQRLARIVAQMDRLHPDIVMIAGDFISDKTLATRHYSLDDAMRPLAGLHPRWGVLAVPGNHDYPRNIQAVKAALARVGVRLLRNEAVKAGPLTVGGIGDLGQADADLPGTLAAMRAFGPPYVLLSHEPDAFNELTSAVPLMLAGHTHCGQIVPPLVGPLVTSSSWGRRYVCGIVREHTSTLVVTGGLGTSDLPVRLGTHPDVWLITLVAPDTQKGPPSLADPL